MRQHHAKCLLVLVIALACPRLGDAQTSSPATQPASRPATAPTSRPGTQPASRPAVKIDEAAKPLLERIRAAYTNEQPRRLVAHITGIFDVAGRSRNYQLEVESLTNGAGRFIHRVRDVGTVAQNAEKLILYDLKRNSFGTLKTPDRRVSASDLPEAVVEILIDENPALLLCLSTEPDKALLLGAMRAHVDAGRLIITSENEKRTLDLDTNGLIRRMEINYTPLLASRGTANVKSALVTLEYAPPELPAAVADAEFEFVPPETASEFPLEPPPAVTAVERVRKRLRATTGPTSGPTSGPATMPSPPATSD
ncbi:MAG: hypothetical protein H7144_18220 [Burkholderiales bacterium]|nr:hypothetical protein [Phycisphaerae bacterium]